MKKNLLFAIFFLSATVASFAQLPNGTLAPNFTATDINGNTYNLYDILDQGKTVVIDFSATWCSPCWAYHQSHALDETWAQYGPNGTNEIMVFFVEGDEDTNHACLYGETGCVGETKGDWVTGVQHPIIDDASLASLFEVSYFPTIFAICPNRVLFETKQKSPSEFLAYAQNCGVAEGNNNANLLELKTGANGDYFCGPTVLRPSAEFQNLGLQNITEIKFDLSFNGTLIQEKTWTGNLATYSIASVEFDPYNLSSDEIIDLTVTIGTVNNVNDESPFDNSYSILMVPNQNFIEENRVRLEMRTDAKPEQTRWEFKDSNGNILYSGGNPAAQPGANQQGLTGGYNPNQFIKDTFNLPAPGCYEFYMVDDRGNGLGEGGFFKLLTMDGTVIFEGGSFETASSNWLQADNIPTSTDALSKTDDQVKVYPNPARDVVGISWDNLDFSPSRVLLFNSLGKMVAEKIVTGHTGATQLQTAQLPQGVYTVVLKEGHKSQAKKLTVIR